MFQFLTRLFTIDPALQAVRSAPSFLALLERERARADRSGEPLSLVEVTQPNGEADQSFLEDLVDYLKHRVRATDQIGSTGDATIGILLPETDPSAAWKLADDIRSAMDTEDEWITCEVSAYPMSACTEANLPTIANEVEVESQPVKPLKLIGPTPGTSRNRSES